MGYHVTRQHIINNQQVKWCCKCSWPDHTWCTYMQWVLLQSTSHKWAKKWRQQSGVLIHIEYRPICGLSHQLSADGIHAMKCDKSTQRTIVYIMLRRCDCGIGAGMESKTLITILSRYKLYRRVRNTRHDYPAPVSVSAYHRFNLLLTNTWHGIKDWSGEWMKSPLTALTSALSACVGHSTADPEVQVESGEGRCMHSYWVSPVQFGPEEIFKSYWFGSVWSLAVPFDL